MPSDKTEQAIDDKIEKIRAKLYRAEYAKAYYQKNKETIKQKFHERYMNASKDKVTRRNTKPDITIPNIVIAPTTFENDPQVIGGALQSPLDDTVVIFEHTLDIKNPVGRPRLSDDKLKNPRKPKPPPGVKRPVGRPRKERPEIPPALEQEELQQPKEKRPVGRPRLPDDKLKNPRKLQKQKNTQEEAL